MTKAAPFVAISLGDKEIRESLIQRLANASKLPKAVLQELRVHNGNAIADVVSVHTHAHCYEIKSDKDSIERAQKQAKYYDLVFRKVTLVTTAKHLDRAKRLVPPYWGIMVAKSEGTMITLAYARRALNTPTFDKQLALFTLWKSELAEVALPITGVNVAKLNRAKLSELIAEKFSANDLAKHIGDQLVRRKFKS